MMTFRSSE